MIYDEQYYLMALSRINHKDYDEKKWLIDNFELFKSTLNWPNELPPINRTNLLDETFKKKFNEYFFESLKKNHFDFDYTKKLLKIKVN